MQRHSYRQEEAQAILERALRQSTPEAGAFSHEELRQMAAELGIGADTLDVAAREWEVERREQQQRREFAASRQRAFFSHLVPYLLVSATLLAINLLSGARPFWALWPLLGWGIGIVSHGLCALRTGGERFEKEFREWRESQVRGGPATRSEAAA